VLRVMVYSKNSSGNDVNEASSITCYVSLYQNGSLLYDRTEVVLSVDTSQYVYEMFFDATHGSNITSSIISISITSDDTYQYQIG
jgi:hypothetical protein